MGAHWLRSFLFISSFPDGLCIGAMDLSIRLFSTCAFLPKAFVPSPPPGSRLLTCFGPGATNVFSILMTSLSLCHYLNVSLYPSLVSMKNTTLTTRDGWCFLFYLFTLASSGLGSFFLFSMYLFFFLLSLSCPVPPVRNRISRLRLG
jgi:hypothetical protein